MEVKGREIFVKWRDDGVWLCPDPTCQARNFLVSLIFGDRLSSDLTISRNRIHASDAVFLRRS